MLSDDELRSMLTALPSIGRSNELAVRTLLATCTRIGELTRAEWTQIDFERKQWTIPPELANYKNGKQFMIPLTEQVAEWFMELKGLAFNSKYVLPIRQRHKGREGDAPMEATSLNAAINRLCESLGDKCRRSTPHDLRSSARSHIAALGVEGLIAERCLNHSLGGLAIERQFPVKTTGNDPLQSVDFLDCGRSNCLLDHVSASTSRSREILRPNALAVLPLMKNSNIDGCSTGKSAGLTLPPLRERGSLVRARRLWHRLSP